MENQKQVIFYSISGSTIKKFLIVDCVIGPALYYAVKAISSSTLIGLAGSILGTEVIKKYFPFKSRKLKGNIG